MSVTLLAALVIGVMIVNLAVAWVLIRGHRDAHDLLVGRAWGSADDGRYERRAERIGALVASENTAQADPPPLSDTDETIGCFHCGAENRPGFRYCRWCVRAGFDESSRTNSSDPGMSRRPL